MPWQSNITCTPGSTSKSSRPVCKVAPPPRRADGPTIGAGIAHESAEVGGGMVGAVQLAPAHALVPDFTVRSIAARLSAAAQELELRRRLHRAREHERIVGVHCLDA